MDNIKITCLCGQHSFGPNDRDAMGEEVQELFPYLEPWDAFRIAGIVMDKSREAVTTDRELLYELLTHSTPNPDTLFMEEGEIGLNVKG